MFYVGASPLQGCAWGLNVAKHIRRVNRLLTLALTEATIALRLYCGLLLAGAETLITS